MSGPYGPNDPAGEGRNDPTQQWGGQQTPGGAGPTQQWGGQPNPQAQPTQQWGGDPNQPPQQQWGQTPGQPQQPWGQQPQQQPQQPWSQTPGQPQQQWGQTPGQPQDWNQQPQQQWGQAGQPQQQWGGQGAGQPPQGGKSKKGLIAALAVVGVLVIAGVVGLILFLTASDELDQTAVQEGVQKVLTDSYGIQDVTDVACPSGQAVEVDATFSCTLKVSGEEKTVNIKITKEDGTYEVGRPS
ncbi:DUF4333 domain-containing protein [Nocardia puris]|uniref:Uncharacterized protein DUF4333 n=1 Tax=Nocardia puris TaxID=208602 RepID=A0A366DXQ0_9NOCA|nr:DUF4333 domain-containing protein [Nocardia puris]MBF6209958.1 DUF4333 domain-containing protein [Nocardia puris]MBF6368150.1 DUF4333 domain-containing protein [Nocardia puris]MBF6458131.1 DUF4333 domain-containing protein [Nocardia puris]RBO94299.1 uncharacterized protein DUF4333 [Nocardia puris]